MATLIETKNISYSVNELTYKHIMRWQLEAWKSKKFLKLNF